MFSKSCEYGLQAMLYIAMNASEDRNVGLREIAANQGIPVHFLSKILQMLVKSKLLNSVKGPNGGFTLRKKPEETNLLNVVASIDGLDLFERCGIGLKLCADHHPCPVHHKFKFLRESIRETLCSENLSDLVFDMQEGKSYLALKIKP